MQPFTDWESNFGSIAEKPSGDTCVMDDSPSKPVDQPLAISQSELNSTIVESEPANAKDTAGFSIIDDSDNEDLDHSPSPLPSPSTFSAGSIFNGEVNAEPNEPDEEDKTENFSQNTIFKTVFMFFFSLFLILAITYYIYPTRFTMLFPDIVSFFTKVKVET